MDERRPFADRLRPSSIEQVVGQDHLFGEGALLSRMLKTGHIPNVIFWGPPGTGKTTVARLLADQTDLHFEQISAIFSGVADLKKVFEAARARRRDQGRGTLLFIDEIHRFNKAQQDSFLPVMEDGTITLVGATTENPSFELNSALLSRAQVLTFKRHDDAAIEKLLTRAETVEGRALPIDERAKKTLINWADGDGRMALNLAEELFLAVKEGEVLSPDELAKLLQKRRPLYDKSAEGHYNLISALHKSVRGSDPDAALYWFARMLEGGEDPMYLARRLIRMAVEEVGLADPQALVQANAAKEAFHMLGSPEGELALAQTVIYLATAPKSNAGYVAYKAARVSAKETGSLMPPKHILNAPTKMMKEQEYGAGYQYDHDAPDGFSGQHYFPDEVRGRLRFYNPVERGFERELAKRLDYWADLRAKRIADLGTKQEKDN